MPVTGSRPLLDLRTRVHLATGLCALALGALPHPWALVAAGLGVFLGFVVFPLSGLDARLRRPGEGFFGGLRTYPLAVLCLVALLPPAEAAAAWGMLAFGDVAAAVVGTRVAAPPVFGHGKATWSGSSAWLIVGTFAGLGLASGAALVAKETGLVDVGVVPGLMRCAVAAGAATLADMLPIPPDDNGPTALAAGATLMLTRGLA